MSDEAFLFLVAVVVSLMVLSLYISLIKSVGTLKSTMLQSFLYQYNVTQVLKENLIIGISKYKDLEGQSNLPSGDQSPLIESNFAYFSNPLNVRLIECPGVQEETMSKYKKELETMAKWFGFEVDIDVLTKPPEKYDKHTLYIFVCKDIKTNGVEFYTLALKNNVYKVQERNSNGVARAFLSFLGCGITSYDYCFETPLTLSKLKKDLVLGKGLIFGYVCPCCIVNIEAYVAAFKGSSEYFGPCSNLTREYKRMSSNDVFVPGTWECFFKTDKGYLLCSEDRCIVVDKVFEVNNEKVTVPQTIKGRITDVCTSYANDCQRLGCFYKAVWYIKSGDTFEQW